MSRKNRKTRKEEGKCYRAAAAANRLMKEAGQVCVGPLVVCFGDNTNCTESCGLCSAHSVMQYSTECGYGTNKAKMTRETETKILKI
jgi:hypothetical protein